MKCLLWTKSILSEQIPLSAQPVIASFVCVTDLCPLKPWKLAIITLLAFHSASEGLHMAFHSCSLPKHLI